jgi:predicted ester cyclase
MKFVIEETKYNGQTLMSKSNYFNTVYSDTKFTDFRKMKHKFIDLIKVTKDRNAMLSFDLDHLHQIVHNYKVSGITTIGDQVSSNLIELVEFMLKDEADLLLSLDLTKL